MGMWWCAVFVVGLGLVMGCGAGPEPTSEAPVVGHAEQGVGTCTGPTGAICRFVTPMEVGVIPLDGRTGWARRANLLDPLTVFLQVKEAGKYTIQSKGTPARFRLEPFLVSLGANYKAPPFRDTGAQWDLDAGFYRMLVPRRYGGYELDLVTFYRVVMEIAHADVSTAWCMCLASTHAHNAASMFDEPAQAMIFGDGDVRIPAVAAPAQAATNQNGQATYTFSSPTYYGGAQGKYELTVVFQTDAGQQYSDDPEFDTGV